MFVGRRDDGTIYGLWSVRQWDGQEKLADDGAEVAEFRARVMPAATKTTTQKLNALGLTVTDLKEALGISNPAPRGME